MSEGNVSAYFGAFYLYTLGETQAHVAVIAPIWILTALLSTLIITTIIKDKQFHTSGYILISALLIIELIYLTIVATLWVLGLALRVGAIYQVPELLSTILANFQEGLFHAVASMLMFISFQRVCCVYAPHKFLSIFTTKFTIFVIFLALFIPSLYMLYLVLDKAYFVNSFEFLTIFAISMHGYQFTIVLVYMFSIAGVSLLNYALIVIKLVFRWGKTKSSVSNVGSNPVNQGSSVGAREVRLTSQFLLITLIYFSSLFTYILPMPTTTDGMKQMMVLMNISWTVIITSDSFIYLTLNRALRKGVWRLIRGGVEQGENSTSAAGGTHRNRAGNGTAVSAI